MPTISGKQFFGGKPGTVVQDVSGKLNVPEEPKKPGYFQRVGQSLKQNVLGLGKDLNKQAETIATEELKGPSLQGMTNQAVALGRGALRTTGAVAKAALTPVLEAPGIKQATEFVGEKLAGTKPIQKYAEWTQKHPEAAKDIENVLDIAGLFGGKEVGAPVSKVASNTIKTVGKEVTEAGASALEGAGEKILSATKNAPSDIMTRVARLTPKEEVAFRNTAGKNLGQYLEDTGNFGAPDEIIAKESQKLVSSRQMVDDKLATLPGEYKVPLADDALNLVIKKGRSTSTENVSSPFLSRAEALFKKNQTVGLNNSEINEVKRLLEREVKLGYNKLMKPLTVQKATNVDDALRKWQFKKAAELGFEDLPEMNKQTQVSKFIVDKLGDQVIGKQALQNVSLTDWIVLSGGDPTSVGAFLTKKFFSSKAIQAKLAKILSKKNAEEIIRPRYNPNPEYLNPSKALPPGGRDNPIPLGPPAEPTIFDPQAPRR